MAATICQVVSMYQVFHLYELGSSQNHPVRQIIILQMKKLRFREIKDHGQITEIRRKGPGTLPDLYFYIIFHIIYIITSNTPDREPRNEAHDHLITLKTSTHHHFSMELCTQNPILIKYSVKVIYDSMPISSR